MFKLHTHTLSHNTLQANCVHWLFRYTSPCSFNLYLIQPYLDDMNLVTWSWLIGQLSKSSTIISVVFTSYWVHWCHVVDTLLLAFFRLVNSCFNRLQDLTEFLQTQQDVLFSLSTRQQFLILQNGLGSTVPSL